MRREVTLNFLNHTLDMIHKGVSLEIIKERVDNFADFDFSDFKLTDDEIRQDRLKEYIKLFNISYFNEYNLFENREQFYMLLSKNLEKSLWEDIKKYLDEGNLLSCYCVEVDE